MSPVGPDCGTPQPLASYMLKHVYGVGMLRLAHMVSQKRGKGDDRRGQKIRGK